MDLKTIPTIVPIIKVILDNDIKEGLFGEVSRHYSITLDEIVEEITRVLKDVNGHAEFSREAVSMLHSMFDSDKKPTTFKMLFNEAINATLIYYTNCINVSPFLNDRDERSSSVLTINLKS